MKFSNYLNSKYVFTDIKANTKEEVIEEIVNRLMDKKIPSMYQERKKF